MADNGSPLAVDMIHQWIAVGTYGYKYGSTYAKHLLREDHILFVRQAIFSGITLGPQVNQLAKSTLALADSLMMMPLCCHYCEVKNLQQCTYLLAASIASYLAGRHSVKLRLS